MMEWMGSMTGPIVVWMLLWTLITLGGLVLIMLGILRLFRTLRRDRRTSTAVEATPREILDRRYAAGEIDEDEYLTRLSGLAQR